MHSRLTLFPRLCVLLILIVALATQPQYAAYALTSLTVTPLTWNVIGLDSNNVNVGPNDFPVGARVCNTGLEAATNVTATWNWDSANAFVNLRPGTLSAINLGTLNAGACADAYFEVEVTRTASAYNTTRRYHISVTAGNVTGTLSTPTPRELFVEHLVSQSRNAVTNVEYGATLASLAPVAAGGTMTLLVGNTYYIRLTGFTATQGYEQLEAFINIPNTIFQILSVSSTYDHPTNPYTIDKLYSDGCGWENDPNSPNYRACLGTGKSGGSIQVTYQVRILQVPGAPLVNPQPLSTLVYDFSGSSFHYNSDYGVSSRYAFILDPATLTIAKNFSPDPTSAGGISTLTFTLGNPNAASVSGLNFTDTLPTTPGLMTIANPTNASTTGCGTPTFAPVAGAGSLVFSNGTIAANGTCTIKVNVTVPAVTTGTYTNTSTHLFLGTLDTGNFATDTLTVNSAPATPPSVCGLAMAQWTFPAGFNTASPAPSSSSVTASASPGAGITSTDFTDGTDSWGSNGNITVGATFASTNNEYVQFALNTTGFSTVYLTFDAARKNTPNSPQGLAVYYGPAVGNPETGTALYSNATALPTGTTAFSSFGGGGTLSFAPSATTMYVRIYFFNSGNTNSGSDVEVDNVTFTGCATPTPPAITKAFGTDPIAVNGTSTLTFTLSNSNSIALTGVTFTDVLPTGLQVAATPAAATTCGGSPTWAPAAAATSLTFGSPTGASIPANSSCTASVNITGTASGSYQNVSGFISSTNGGTNTGSTGSASASLSVIKPPSMAKLFSANPILVNGTSTLTFTITNPNQNDSLTGLAFTDTFPTIPGALTVAAPLTTSNTCGGALQDNLGGALAAGDLGIRLTGGTLTGGSTCTVTVNVTAATVGNYANTSGAVSSTNGGTGNTASDTLTIKAANPSIALLKQVSTSAAGPWSSYITVNAGTNVYYQFTVENTGDVPLSPVSVTDPTVSTASCTWPASLPVAVAANNNHIATCVVGPIVAVTGSHINTATASGTYSGTPYTSTGSSATYSTPGVTLVKSATETSFTIAGDLLHYSYLVSNSGFAPLLGPVTITDNKITLPNTVTCPAVNTVGDLDDWFDPGESLTCTATYTVTAADVIAGSVTNTASASVGGFTSNTSSKTVFTLRPDLTVTKTNNVSGSVAQNGSFNWTITVSNGGIATASFLDTFVLMSDTLPGVAAYYPQGGLTVTNGSTLPTGTINCSITGTALTCLASGIVTLPIASSFSVTFAVTPTAAGSLANTATVDPNGNVLEISEVNNTGSDTVTVVAPPSISKSFGAASLPIGATSTLSFTITNPNATTILTGVAFSDTLPSGLTIADSSITQCGGTLTTTAATGVISLSGAAIAGGGTCSFSVTVTASSAGTKNNVTGSVTSTNGGTGNTGSASTTVVAPPTIAKAFTPGSITVNGTSTLTFTITNPAANTVALTGVAFTDLYPVGVGLQNTAVPNASTTCAGGTVTAAANGPSVALSGASLAVNTSCTVTVTVTGTSAGTKTNSVTVASTNGGTGNTSTASLGVISATKSVIGTSEDSTASNNVAIGEIVRYRLVIDLPEGTTTNLQILDNIVTNLRYFNDSSTKIAFVCNSGAACATSSTASIGFNPVISGSSGNVTPTFILPAATITNNTSGTTTNPFPSGDDPLFSLGNITNSDSDADNEYVVVEFNALIANLLANQDTNNRNNTFSVLVGGTNLTTSAAVTVTIVEPALTSFTKVITTTPSEAGDTIAYQLQFTNTGTSSAFDIVVTDALNAALTTPVTVTGSTTGGACGSTTSTVSGSYSAPNATATVTCLAVGGTATINISATVSSSAPAGYTFSNSASLTYSSLPGAGTANGSGGNNTGSTTPGAGGSSTGERNGSGGTNDYTAATGSVTTTLASPSLAKTINPAGATYAIGATIPYQITITVPEGVTGNPIATVVDAIPTGLTYVAGSLTVTPQAGVTIGTAGPYTDANAAFFNLTGQTLTLNFGSFTSTASAAATNRTIVIAFNARVDNVVGNQSGTAFTNSADFTRTDPNAAGTLTLTATSPAVSVIEPVLAVSKAASTATPPYNSTLTYTLTVNHNGASNASAYDTVITDILPSGLTNLTNVNVSSTAPAACATGVVNNSTSSALSVTVGTIPLACAVTITYDVTVSGAVASTQTNSVNVAWTSGSGSVTGERTGADGVGGALNDYAATTSQTVTIGGADLNTLKTDGSTTYTAGSPIAYTITVSNTGNTTATGTVTDNFLPALTNITWTCSGTGAATCGASGNGNISDAVSIPASESVTYAISATVVSSATGNLINTASAALSVGTDPTPLNNSSTDTDTPNPQSDLAITKTDSIANVAANGTTTYTIRVTNNGPSDVTGAVFSDAAATGLSKTSVVCSATPGQCVTPPTIAQLEGGSFALPALASGQFYEVTVTASVTATSGTVTNIATVAAPAGTTDPTSGNNTASDTDNVVNIDAVNDTGSTVNGTAGGQSLTDVLANDTLNGSPATLASINLTQISTTNAGVTLNTANGSVNVAPGTPAGNYVVTYQICDQANPAICDTATVMVPVVVIDAVNDTGSTVNGTTGGQSLADVLVNDTLDGNPATLANVNLTQVSTTNAGVTLDVTTGAVNVAPGTPSGNYTVIYQICDQANPTICDTATVSVPVVVIDAVNDSGSAVNGATGGQSLADVLTNDTLNGNPATLANVNLTQVSTSNAGVTLDATTGAINVAPGTPSGNYTVTYQICDQANPTICDTATVSIPVVVIDAVNDSGSTVNGTLGGQSLVDVLTNDTFDGNPATLANVNLTQVSTTNAGVTLDVTTGAVSVAPGTPAGNYTVTYQICDQANPTICDTATVSVPVVVIDAVNDTGATVNGTAGGQSLANVLTNDTLSGSPATLANINLTQVSTTNPGVTLNVATGAVNVAPGTPSGNYTVTYRICDQANPAICDTATVTVPVAVINAVNDTGANVNGTTGGQALADVLVNDTLDGNPATLANVTLSQVSTTNPGVTLDVTTGAVNVAPGTPSGTYTVTYQICDQANPAICDTATVSVPVVVIDAVDDDFSGTPVNGYTGGSAGNAFSNDTLNGVVIVPTQITATVTSPASDPGVTLNTTSGSVNVAAGTPAGTYTIGYLICDQANPTICDPATITIVVDPPAINAVDDDFSGTPVNGYTGGNAGNAFTNDTLNGVAIVPAQITATVTSPASDPGVTLNISTGSVNVAAGTPAGIYTIGYQICENLNPTNCDIATITVVVAPPVINAVNDAALGINGITGATAVLNVFNNDTLNGVPVVPSEVALTETVPDPSGALTLNPNGTVDVAPGTPAGIYQLTYRICEVLNPTNCDTAVVSITVGLPPAPVAQNDSTTTPFNTPVTLPDITANDTAFGTGNSILINTIDLDPGTPGPQTNFTDLNGNQWSVNTTTGDVTFTPAANYTGTATIPYDVQDASGQKATANLSVTVGPPASISGVVFNDADLNGTKSASEVGIVGVQVALYDSTGTTLIASTTTTAGGGYSFPNVTPGTYLVIESDPAGYVSSTPNSVSATVSAGGTATVNFGDYQLPNTAIAALNGTVFNDVNGNGIQDTGETALSGVTVQLKDNGGTVIATTTTNGAGGYSFPNLNAGTYTVTETDPVGYISTTLNNVSINLSAGTIATVNFGDQTSGAAIIADPAITKLGSPTNATVGSIVVYTITVGNNGNANASNVVLTDTKPAFLDIISITISPNPGLTPVVTANTFTINFGTVTPTDLYSVTVVTRVNSLGRPPGGSNNVSITTGSGTDRSANNFSSAAVQIPSNNPGGNPGPSLLPGTGFAPGVVTDLSDAPRTQYAAVGDLILEIPSLGVKIPVVGVPQKNGAWDVAWLGKQAGWLEGTAFPSWNGNSVLTSHVYLSDGLPGPFVNVNKLKYGDMLIIHAYGQKYIFEVSTNQVVAPNDGSALKHEEKPWLTLITCKEYDEKTNTYKKRVVVRAVLVEVAWDK